MFLFASARVPRAYVFTLNNAHFKLQNHMTGILENLLRRHVTSCETELVIVPHVAEGNELVSATSALSLANMLKRFTKHRTIVAKDGTHTAVLAFEVGRAETYATSEDTVVVVHDSPHGEDAILEFLSRQTVSGRKIHVVNVRDYLLRKPLLSVEAFVSESQKTVEAQCDTPSAPAPAVVSQPERAARLTTPPRVHISKHSPP